MISDVLTGMAKISLLGCNVVLPGSVYLRFGGALCLHLQGNNRITSFFYPKDDESTFLRSRDACQNIRRHFLEDNYRIFFNLKYS
jgi:hypothetical protein